MKRGPFDTDVPFPKSLDVATLVAEDGFWSYWLIKTFWDRPVTWYFGRACTGAWKAFMTTATYMTGISRCAPRR